MAAELLERAKKINPNLIVKEENEDFYCYDCNTGFVSESYLLEHLHHHIKQPLVVLEKTHHAPAIKLTLKSTSYNRFEVIQSPPFSSTLYSPTSLSGDGNSYTNPDGDNSRILAEFEESNEDSSTEGTLTKNVDTEDDDGTGDLDEMHSEMEEEIFHEDGEDMDPLVEGDHIDEENFNSDHHHLNLDHLESDFSSEHNFDHSFDQNSEHSLDHNSELISDHNSEHNSELNSELVSDYNSENNSEHSSEHNSEHSSENNTEHNSQLNKSQQNLKQCSGHNSDSRQHSNYNADLHSDNNSDMLSSDILNSEHIKRVLNSDHIKLKRVNSEQLNTARHSVQRSSNHTNSKVPKQHNLGSNSEQISTIENVEDIGEIDAIGNETNVNFSPNYVEGCEEPLNNEEKNESGVDTGGIPGTEPTPPPEPVTEYPKIRIKTGLLKESLTITEIANDNPNGSYDRPEMIELHETHLENTIWPTPSLEDPLRLPDTTDKDDNSILSNLFNNSDKAKDLGFTTSDSEYISLDRLDDRNRNALQIYSSSSSLPHNNNPLDSLAGLPMQQLAQQVSRLQPNRMHQQNVLINIQQFPQAPPPQPHPYQPPPMYPHPPQPPMYHQPYQYQPPNPMYYPPAPQYPPHMPPPPPRPQMPQHPQSMSQHMPPMQQPPQYQQPMPNPRQPPAPRQPNVQHSSRGTMGPRQQGHSMPTRQPMNVQRQRAPAAPRPRGPVPGPMRAPRPRMPMQSQNGQQQQQQQHQQQQQLGPRMMKRTPEQIQALQASKRKRMDVLVPDKHDDADCQVIAVQPKNTGLPQIQSVQGGAPENSNNVHNGSDNSIMHLSDSITLSVRNPPPKPASPKKSDAKAVANILATRGITVTATAKPKEKQIAPVKSASPPVPVAINLNSAVSIIPSAKTNAKPVEKLPTVDLTDDTPPEPSRQQAKPAPPKQPQRGLPFRCDLCPAQYPNSVGLAKHRQTFHKTGGSCDFGIPLIDIKQPGILQRLNNIGIHNYIPLGAAGVNGTLALPVINVNSLKNNPNSLGAIGTSSVLTLGPIRTFQRQQQTNMNNSNK